MCFKVRRLERVWFPQNQPSFQPWTLRYEIWNGVGFRKTNRHSNYRLRYTKVGTGLVFAKPTAIPTMGYDISRLERDWFPQNQSPFQPWASIYESWNAFGFRKSNCQSISCRSCMRVGKRLVFVNPTVIPTMCFKVRSLERGWFSQNQPSFQPWTLRYDSWNVVGFRNTNRHYNHGLQYTKVGTRLVFAIPTVIPTMGYDTRKLERGWFSQNQPPFQP